MFATVRYSSINEPSQQSKKQNGSYLDLNLQAVTRISIIDYHLSECHPSITE
jgi:hypothetical protein